MSRRMVKVGIGVCAAGIAITIPFCAMSNTPEVLYGPPPDSSNSSSSLSAPSNQKEDANELPLDGFFSVSDSSFSASKNVMDPLYGPPPSSESSRPSGETNGDEGEDESETSSNAASSDAPRDGAAGGNS